MQILRTGMLPVDATEKPKRSNRVPAAATEFADNATTQANQSVPHRPVKQRVQKGKAGGRENECLSRAPAQLIQESSKRCVMATEIDAGPESNQIVRRDFGRTDFFG